MVNLLVRVNTRHDVRRRVIAALADALVDGLLGVPPLPARELLLGLDHPAEELNVPAGEQIEAAVDVDDALADPRSLARQEPRKDALLLDRGLGLGLPRRSPEPHLDAGVLARLVGSIELHPLRQGLRLGLDLVPGRGTLTLALIAGQEILERLDEVRLCAEEHAADEVGGGDAGGALDDLEAPGLLDEAVAVVAVGVRGDVVAVDDVLAAIVADPVELRHVRGLADGFCDPAAGVHGGQAFGCMSVMVCEVEWEDVPLLEGHDCWALVLENGLIGVDADVELAA